MKPEATSIGCNHYPPRNVLTLEQLWKDKLRQNSNEILAKEFTMKDRGMLKHFIRYVSPCDPYAVMETALNNWSDYVHLVECWVGLNCVPPKPSIPFLLKYCGEAANFHLNMNKPKAVKPEVGIKKTPKVDIDSMLENMDEPMTLEELLALEEKHG